MAALATLVLSSCTSFIPPYERPAAPVAPSWPDASTTAPAGSPAAGAPATAVAELPWSDFLADARIRALVEIAQRNNRDLRLAVLNVEQVRAQLGIQRADLLPSVGAGANFTRAPNTSGVMTSVYSLGFAVSSYELDLFGRVRSLEQAALARYLASDEGRRAAQVSLIAAVASAELAVRADDELLEVTQRALRSREESLRLVRVRFDGGVSAEPELRGAESLLAAARASLAGLQRQRSLDGNALVLLLGQPLPADLPPAQPLEQVRFAQLPVGLPSEVLLKRPDIAQAEQQLLAANANIGAARAAFFPRITLTGSLGTASSQLSGLFDKVAWTFAPQLLYPLFDSGRKESNLAAAKAGRDIAVAQYEKAIQVAFREVADALAGRATLGEQLAAQRAQVAAEDRRAELAGQLLRGGAASQLDLLDAERARLAARQAVVQLELARLQNAVLLYRVLGGGAGQPQVQPLGG
jgi:NodT family efflux transporter outer membrane factor (OMF) lipoprotein